MKRLTKMQKFSAIIGAGLLIAAASGPAFAMHIAEDRDQRDIEVRLEKTPAPRTSPLPTATAEPTAQPGDAVEFRGAVEVMASDMWVVGGRTVAVTVVTEIKSGLSIGTVAKVHAIRQADGSLWAREIESAREIEPTENHDQDNGNSNDNGNDDHENGNGNINSNDDNGNDDNGNVNTNGDNGNDDNGNVNTNDDNSNGDNGNDDHGGSGHDNDNGH